MAKSFTKKEKTLAGKLLVDVSAKRAEQWIQKEFALIRSNTKNPVIALLPGHTDKWAIGRYQLDQLGNHMWHLHYADNDDQMFYSKKAAVFYAILTQRHQYKNADALLKLDQSVAKYKDELVFFSKKLTNKTLDAFSLELYEIRYTDNKILYDNAKEELEKTLIQAKYNKVLEQLL